jgi:hypothetical protein
MTSSPLADPPSPKYRRAAITLQLGVPETWAVDGSEAQIVRAIEDLFNSNESGVGPGGSILHTMFVLSWKPGDIARLPSGEPIEPLLKKWRLEYRLVPRSPHPAGHECEADCVPHSDRKPIAEPVVREPIRMAGRDFDIDGNDWA